MVAIYNLVLDKHAPWRTMVFENNLPVWITREFLSMCKLRDNKKKVSKKNGNQELKQEYNRIRNRVTQFGRSLKQNYFSMVFEEAGNDSMKLRCIIKQLFGIGHKNHKINEINGSTNDKDMAKVINNVFADVGSNLAKEIPDSLLELDLTFKGEYDPFMFDVMTELDIGELLDNMSVNKSTGIDGVPIGFLQMARNLLVKLIINIMNKSLTTMIVPDGWKKACITPLYKAGDRTEPGNYRPIAFLPAACKLLEQVVHIHVTEYFKDHSLLSEAQFGFRKGFSTNTCILHLLDHIYKNIDVGNLTGAVFLDLKKAFDTVDHRILLQKLHKYGIIGQSNKWFENYLTDRTQVAKVNRVVSTPRQVQYGVPQWSILGPLLFIIYVNDLEEYISKCKVNLYAYDTVVYYSSPLYIELVLAMRIELENVNKWLRANKLTVNVSKTKYLVMGSKNKLKQMNDISPKLNNEAIERVHEFKYL